MTIDLDHGQLRRHARNVGSVSTELGSMASAADTVDLDGGAFGLLCSFLPPILQAFTPTQADAIRQAGEVATGTETALTWAANDLESADDYLAEQLNSLKDRWT